VISGTNTYDFTFSTISGTYNTLMQMQTSKVSNGAPMPLAFELFSGTPGSGTWIATSATQPAASLLQTLKPGAYYLQLSIKKAPKEYLTGGVTLLSSVPEPATWATMLIGLGGLGALLRRRRMPVATAA
jgi:hypothetical protein